MSVGLKSAILALLSLVLSFSASVNGSKVVPCYFVFGGGYFDNGNNNKLDTTFKADYRPYGIDSRTSPNGRFTNALNIDDFIAIAFGFKGVIPPYVDYDKLFDVTKGINYASASAGISSATGRHAGARSGMTEQLNNHELIVERIKQGYNTNETAMEYIGKCLYTVSLGDNDYINHFLNQSYNPTHVLDPENFAKQNIGSLTVQMNRLARNYGAQKIAIFNIPPLGCSPFLAAKLAKNGSPCADDVNDAIKVFNKKLNELVDFFNERHRIAKFITINTYDITLSLFREFKVTNAPCCPINKETGLCIPESTPCANRFESIWFDGIHQSEGAYAKIARRAMNAESKTDVYPFDITHLMKPT